MPKSFHVDENGIARDRHGHLVKGTNSLVLESGKWAGSRKAIRQLFPDGGVELYKILLDLARGEAYVPKLPDGRTGDPIVPTPDVRLRAATELAHTLNGRPVTQGEILKAEADDSEVASVRALSDADLNERVKGLLTRGLEALDARKGQPEALEAEAEIVTSEANDLAPKVSNKITLADTPLPEPTAASGTLVATPHVSGAASSVSSGEGIGPRAWFKKKVD